MRTGVGAATRTQGGRERPGKGRSLGAPQPRAPPNPVHRGGLASPDWRLWLLQVKPERLRREAVERLSRRGWPLGPKVPFKMLCGF